MDQVVLTRVNHLVQYHRSFLRNVLVICEIGVQLSQHPWLSKGDTELYKGDEHLDHHCLSNFEAHVNVPSGHVVVEWSLEILGEPVWVMFGQICID